MYKNKTAGGKNNICGQRVKEIREALPENPPSESWPARCKLPDLISAKRHPAIGKREKIRNGY